MPVTLQLCLPDTVVQVLGWKTSEAGGALKRELAVHFFQEKSLSFGQARQLADLPVWDFLELLQKRKVPLHYDAVELDDDLATLKRL